MRSMTCTLACIGMTLINGCAWQPVQPPAEQTTRAVPEQLPLLFNAQHKTSWEAVTLPGKLRTAFRHTSHEGRPSLEAQSQASASMLRQRLSIAPTQLGLLHFEWQVAGLIEGADMTQRDAEDSPVRLMLAFDGDRSRFSARNAMLSELTLSLSGEAMPYAVLMYVWSNQHPVGTVITNPRTDRIRKIVVESGPQRLRQWLRYERDVRADFVQAFGEAPGMLQSIAIMTDSDNTQGRAQAWYGPIGLSPSSASAR